MPSDHIEVHLGDDAVGQAWIHTSTSSVSTVFAYEPEHLARPGTISIDPALGLFTGNQAVDGLPGAFRDAAPDRWGRNLITKRHLAAGERRSLTDADFLLGVSDMTRQGALRFKRPGSGPFLGATADVPKLIALPELLHAADQVTTDDDLAAVKTLLAAGSGSLGGARPKASVLDNDDRLAIAKFPKPGDEWDVMAWEATALDVAEAAGCVVPTRRLVEIDGRHALILHRFDRIGDTRIPYVSAMTLLEANDGDAYDYLDIVDALIDHSAAPRRDLTELFRRAAVNVALHNTDDHLRNHGFIHLGAGGWQLSPVFDVNPNPDTNEPRVTSVAGATTIADEPSALLALASECRLAHDEAKTILQTVHSAVSQWTASAQHNRIRQSAHRRFAEMFAAGLEAVTTAAARLSSRSVG